MKVKCKYVLWFKKKKAKAYKQTTTTTRKQMSLEIYEKRFKRNEKILNLIYLANDAIAHISSCNSQFVKANLIQSKI